MSTRVLTFPRRVRRLGQHLRPLIVRRGAPSAGSVLAYIERMQEYARRQHRGELERHYAELWRFIFEVTHGTLPRSPAASVRPAPASEAPAPAAIPPWRRQMLARPMRRVVALQFDLVQESRHGERFPVCIMHLSCGHKVTDGLITPSDPTPKRRRCRECACNHDNH